MKQFFYKSVFIKSLLLVSLFCHAQKATVKASVDKNKILLGERFN